MGRRQSGALTARYDPSGDNAELRHVLRIVWQLRCYWCNNFKDYLDLEIDHILPKSASDRQLARLVRDLGLRTDFDVHEPYNLAPICGNCNRSKGDQDLTEITAVIRKLRRAEALSSTVVRRLSQFYDAAEIGEALLKVVNADLSNPSVRDTLADGTEAIVRRFAELNSNWADIVLPLLVELEVCEITVAVPESGRTALAVLQEAAGDPLDVIFDAPVRDLLHRVGEEVGGALCQLEGEQGAPVAGEASFFTYALVIDSVSYKMSLPEEISFAFEGQFDLGASASISRSSADGGELEEKQGDAAAVGRFSFELNWDASQADEPLSFDRVWIDPIDVEPWIN